MKPFDWNSDKNSLLKAQRGVNFDDAVKAILAGKLLDRINHANQKKYPGQEIFIVEINNYYYNVPFIETAEILFLKTIYPSRKSVKQYRARKENNL